MIHSCNPRTLEAEAEGSLVQGQYGLYSVILQRWERGEREGGRGGGRRKTKIKQNAKKVMHTMWNTFCTDLIEVSSPHENRGNSRRELQVVTRFTSPRDLKQLPYVQVFNPFGSTTRQKPLIELKRKEPSAAIAGHNRWIIHFQINWVRTFGHVCQVYFIVWFAG